MRKPMPPSSVSRPSGWGPSNPGSDRGARPSCRVYVHRWARRENMADWWLTKDGDLDCAELYNRHYSAYRYADGRARHCGQFVGPGEKVVLRTERADALFVWRRFIDDSGQGGINCAVFRNE